MPRALDIPIEELNRLLAVMRDKSRPIRERLDAAIKAAPYCHERLSPEDPDDDELEFGAL